MGTVAFMKYRLQTFPGARVCPSRLTQSPLEGTFGYARSFQSGTGKLLFGTLVRAFGQIQFLREDKIVTRLGQLQCVQPNDEGTAFIAISSLQKHSGKRTRPSDYKPRWAEFDQKFLGIEADPGMQRAAQKAPVSTEITGLSIKDMQTRWSGVVFTGPLPAGHRWPGFYLGSLMVAGERSRMLYDPVGNVVGTVSDTDGLVYSRTRPIRNEEKSS
jgi:hypothetical protein